MIWSTRNMGFMKLPFSLRIYARMTFPMGKQHAIYVRAALILLRVKRPFEILVLLSIAPLTTFPSLRARAKLF